MDIRVFYPNYKADIEIEGITSNSKEVKKNYLFVAICGSKHNGLEFVNEAIENGASLIVCSNPIDFNIPSIRVPDTKVEYIRLLQLFYNYNPIDHNIIGITGTDGKTTTALMLHHIMNFENHSSYIGTNGIQYHSKNIPTINTTIDPKSFYYTLEEFINNDIKYTVMEVSSEGIKDKRVSQLYFNGAIFTNLTHEHLNTHKTMKSYFETKLKLFESLDSEALCVINSDDYYGRKIISHTKAKIITYGMKKALYMAKNIFLYKEKIRYDLYYKNIFLDKITIYLFGTYNVYNSLAAIAYAYEFGIPLKTIKSRLLNMDKIDGRFERFFYNQNTFIVDFAHTPNALNQLLSNLKKINHNKLIVILGSAGEKDWTKRHLMGSIATNIADIVIFTSEDPKNESLIDILADLTKNAKDNYYLSYDRKEAIKLGISLLTRNDILVVAGKGNELHENIKGQLVFHNDTYEIKKALGI